MKRYIRANQKDFIDNKNLMDNKQNIGYAKLCNKYLRLKTEENRLA